MSGFFKVFSVVDLEFAKEGDQFKESDYSTITPAGRFVQMNYIEENTVDKYEVHPGIWKISKTAVGFRLKKSVFTNDEILQSFFNTQELENKIDCFFRNLDEYKALKIEVPKRAALLYGPAGTGKTSNAIHISNKYVNQDKKTAVIIWNTDAHDPFEVKSFIQTFTYTGVTKLILIAEDIGGVEIDKVRMKSTSSLLSLLDNKEKTFSIPVFIIATTNHPENFLGNITNRPGRFDDRIHVGNPNPAQRKELFLFFLRNFKDKYTTEQINKTTLEIISKEYNELSIAHIQEVIIKSRIYEQPLDICLKAIKKDIDLYNNEFVKNKTKLGIGIGADDDE